MKQVTEVSVRIDLEQGTATILDSFELLEDNGIHIINEDGSEELDVWIESKITKDKMLSSVIEFAKFQDVWIRKPQGALSSRYPNGQVMVMTDDVYVSLTVENGQITGFEQSNGVEHLEEVEILDYTDAENPISFEPKVFETRIKAGWMPMYSTFKSFTNIVALMTKNMKGRVL
jgi:hypothetical protein